MFTPGQYRLLTDLRRRAWAAECARTGIAPNQRAAEDAWYRNVLWSALRVRTSKACNHAMDFDLVCLAMAQLSGDDREIGYWSLAATRRFAWLIRGKLSWLDRVTGRKHEWSYVVGILKQMRLPAALEDVPVEWMRNVLIALDTHCRRICRANLEHEDAGDVPAHHAFRADANLPF